MSLADPEVVRAQYATEAGLETRRSLYENAEGAENGAAILERHFATVERIDIDGWVTFPDAEAIRRYIRSMILIAEDGSAERVADDVGPVRAGVRVTVFVAGRA